jgi:hypothetical protein
MMPSRFLSQEDIGHPLRRQLLFSRGGLLALDERQTRFPVGSDDGLWYIWFFVHRNLETFAQQVGYRILELPSLVQSPEFI